MFYNRLNSQLLIDAFRKKKKLVHVRVAFVFTAEKMERALGDLGPDNGENGIQVCVCILVSVCVGKRKITLITDLLCCFECFPFFRIRRNEPSVKGTIIFDANSTITISPVNFQ